MGTKSFCILHLWRWRNLAFFFMLQAHTFGISTDGLILLSFKNSILSDPFGVLKNWDENDEFPCSWIGVSCGTSGSAEAFLRVTSLILPGLQLLGSIPSNLGMIEHLRYLNLSGNYITGPIPSSLFIASELRFLDFSNNNFTGQLPQNLTALQNLTVISLKNNSISGSLPGGFNSVQSLDVSSNFINGSLPPDFGGTKISYFNVSFNSLSGEVPAEFAAKIPTNATIDLSFNDFYGPIPNSDIFFHQDIKSYSGNQRLCGKPLNNLCSIPSSIATLPDSPESTPAIAAYPTDSDTAPGPGPSRGKRTGLKTGKILGIIIGDVAGVGILILIFIYIYHHKKKKIKDGTDEKETEFAKDHFDWASPETSSRQCHCIRAWACSKKQRHGAATEDEAETSSEITTSCTTDTEDSLRNRESHVPQEQKKGSLVTVDGEKELELETLLKASAYILGASGSSILYKAVLEDGTTLAVRRIGESGVDRFRDFENQIRVIAKLIHPNLIRIRGFYWGEDEKLIIYDFVPHGSLANARSRKAGSSPCPLPWEVRVKIAKGLARGLCYIHEKKQVHGNLKPSNILLGPGMEPKIGDFGLERLVIGDNSSRAGGSNRNFGSKRSTASNDHTIIGPTPTPSPSIIRTSPYHAPESLRNLRPSPKWDVFAFGVVLLELLTGKAIVSDETCPGLAIRNFTSSEEDRGKILRMADVAIRADVEGKEEALLALLKLGCGCISSVPQKRPSMKEVLQSLDKIEPFPSSSPYDYGQL
ncbi:putative LRR receptor-like serine/threonine-protein kinase-like [Dorcoceras hygrometricum]|uniref:Putative LRR receptor-like serine/threonine-protein kinase-like n=1 Tax=Dorcoceras hygrometricum TaxID=472368 RepID=A0A2Z7BYL5_9LAMI|nr:putative LRR receptor-like serine/threonine-protein kinase-like [Dorcoceras hygrometricum]